MDSCLICAEASGLATPLAFADDVASAFPARFRGRANPGAVLVVSRTHHPDLDRLPVALVGPFFERVQAMAVAVLHVSGADGTTLLQNNHPPGQEIAHLHVHIIPRFVGDGWPHSETVEVSAQERIDLAGQLREVLG